MQAPCLGVISDTELFVILQTQIHYHVLLIFMSIFSQPVHFSPISTVTAAHHLSAELGVVFVLRTVHPLLLFPASGFSLLSIKATGRLVKRSFGHLSQNHPTHLFSSFFLPLLLPPSLLFFLQ